MTEKTYTVKNGMSLRTKAGIKEHGAEVTRKMIGKNFEALIEKGFLVESEPENEDTSEDASQAESSESVSGEEDLNGKAKDELLEIAAGLEIEMTSRNTKPELIDAIETARKKTAVAGSGAIRKSDGEIA